MVELSKFDLQLSLGALRTQGKDVEDQAGAVDDPALQRPFQIALLRWREFMIEDHQLGCMRHNFSGDLLHLALAGESRRVGAVAFPGHLGTHGRPGGLGQQANFLKPVRLIVAAEIKLDDDRTFASRRALKHSGISS